jgi:S-adenosylmethionine:tRNA ribosyltransferase-isomerase
MTVERNSLQSMKTSLFHYTLPTGAIAQVPAEPRDSARLLVVPGLEDRRFSDLPGLLEPGDLVVVNRTRVRRARLVGRKLPSGGRIELLLLNRVGGGRWEALARPTRRLRAGTRIAFGKLAAEVVSEPVGGKITVAFQAPEDHIEAAGEVPLPPYITEELADPERYQTMFAKTLASAAAPTAGLHFTPAIVERLADRDIEMAEVDLAVGVDTFRPIAATRIEDHEIHSERFEVSAEVVATVEAARARGGSVVAVGTTVVRALESAARGGRIEPMRDSTDLFIKPGFRFRVVDRLVTNFHVPGSSLVVLVAAFTGDGWRRAYAHALDAGYRFLSFGDAMLTDRA